MRSRSSLLKICGVLVVLGIITLGFFSPQTQETSQQNTNPLSLSLITEPDAGTVPLISLINNATSSIDLVMYELSDMQIENALVAAEKRGVSVQVLLNHGYYGDGKTLNTDTYTYLQKNHVPVGWTPSYFALTHQKTLIVDGKTALIMSFNLVPKYYASDRDFGIIDTDTADVSAIEATFESDWHGTNQISTNGDNLIWSPGSEEALLSLINQATSSLFIYNEEMSDSKIIDALVQAVEHGVHVEILMTDQTSWHTAFAKLVAAGADVRTYSANAPLYIHAKMILADDHTAFIGSENFSTGSLTENRELGIELADQSVLVSLQKTFTTDWITATIFTK